MSTTEQKALWNQWGEGNQKGASLTVQWLRLCLAMWGGVGLIPDQGTKILHALQPKNKTK